jgi:hypothetical protein
MGTDHKHQNEGPRRFSGWDLPIAGAIPRVFVGDNDQRDGWLFEGDDRIDVEITSPDGYIYSDER